MTEPINNLIEALREELKQYGEMLALLDQEKDVVVLRQTADILPCVVAINAQAETLQVVHHERDQRRRHLARILHLSEEISSKDLIVRLPPEYQPLTQALVQENKELLFRVQQRARENHLLLSRLVELMQKLTNPVSTIPIS